MRVDDAGHVSDVFRISIGVRSGHRGSWGHGWRWGWRSERGRSRGASVDRGDEVMGGKME